MSRAKHNHNHNIQASGNQNVILFGFLLTFSFMIVEVIGGLLSGSLALIADAGHMLTDSFALVLAWMGFYFGKKKKNKIKTFGYLRFEVLAGFVNAISLFLITIWIGFEAFERFINPPEISTLPMFIIAVIGLGVNLSVLFVLNKGDKEHVNIKGALLHVIGDLLGSIAVILAAIIIYFTGLAIVDPILSLVVAVLILRSAWILLNGTLNILMQGTPPEISIDAIKNEIKRKNKNIKNVSHIHVWTLTSGRYIATLEIELAKGADAIKETKAVKTVMESTFDIGHTTVGISDGSICSTEEECL